jgi:hypothetical protein
VPEMQQKFHTRTCSIKHARIMQAFPWSIYSQLINKSLARGVLHVHVFDTTPALLLLLPPPLLGHTQFWPWFKSSPVRDLSSNYSQTCK